MRFNLLVALYFLSLTLVIASGDSSIVFTAQYTKQEVKKEAKDIKEYNKVVKVFKKSISSKNIDLKNSTLSDLKSQMKKEYEELNSRITSRAKKVSTFKRTSDTLISGDIPQGYNPTIKGQIERVEKSDVLKGKNETEILLLYTKILNKQNRIIRQLDSLEELTITTPNSTYESVLKNAGDFKMTLSEELKLLNKEKGKKK